MEYQVIISAGFDDLRARDARLLESAARLGEVVIYLWSDSRISQETGRAPKFPFAERFYFLNSVRFVRRVIAADNFPEVTAAPPPAAAAPSAGPRKKVLVTGTYDWLHSGHVRFFEEASALGDLYVAVGQDANIRLLKGEGHPLLPQEERRYMVNAIKFVKQTLICSGTGWLDAEPEINVIKPDIYAVNEDGDRGGKREFCERRGIEYAVLRRQPAAGLPARSSTDLRGF
ncbi:MAG TPA: adenylyltransferase/cytidyltransferase family protein [Verrucomicrobiae bacterium]|jgi:cytidyltransferase-like protein